MNNNVTLKDFYPVNKWIIDDKGPEYDDCVQYRYIIDQTTGRSYLNESANVVKDKCTLLVLGTPFIHLVASIINVAYRIFKLVTLYHFKELLTKANNPPTFKACLNEAGKDALRIITAIFAYVLLEIAACYGTIRPYDGRKLYATIERAQYGNFILAPCFQPDASRHLFGGNINTKNAF